MGQRVGMAVLAVALVIGGAYAVAGNTRSLVVVEVGPDHSISSKWVAGEPVWVINDGDEVLVLSAVNPHPWWGIDELVGWCESVRGLQSWWDGSRFDIEGRYIFGPAPRDLDRHPVLGRAGNTASIGPLTRSPGRSSDADELSGTWCEGDGQQGPDARYHRTANSVATNWSTFSISAPSNRPVLRGAGARIGGAGHPRSKCPSDQVSRAVRHGPGGFLLKNA